LGNDIYAFGILAAQEARRAGGRIDVVCSWTICWERRASW
jgi:hypothetical protein